jgi:hypothetical protein
MKEIFEAIGRIFGGKKILNDQSSEISHILILIKIFYALKKEKNYLNT